MLLQFSAILVVLACYCWHRYSPYFKFPCHFWITFKFFKWAFLTRESEREPLGRCSFQFISSACKKYEKEGMCVLWLPYPMLFVYSEESVKFFANEETMMSKPYVYDFMLPEKMYSSLFASGGVRARKERRLISPAFKIGVLKEMVPAMNRHAAALVEDLGRYQNETIDIVIELVKTNSIRQFYENSLGFKPAAEEEKERARRLMVITDRYAELFWLRIFRPWLHFDFIWKMSPYSKDFKECAEDAKGLIMEILPHLEERTLLRNLSKSASEDLESETQSIVTFGEVLMELHLKDPSSFTKEDLIGQLFTVIVAGFDTSSTTIMWTLWLLGLHPNVQEKAYEEITSETDGFLTFDDTRKLSYLECVIKECLRLYPVAPVFGRRSNRDIHFGKYKIPKNTSVMLSPYVLHRNPEIYPDPESFNPDRFRTTTSSKHPWAYIPFAEGVRSCIGKNYAMLQMKIFLAHVIRNFKIVSLDRREDVHESWAVIIHPAKPLRLKFVPR